MSPIVFQQTQTREQRLSKLAKEITKAGGLSEFFSKLASATDVSRSVAAPIPKEPSPSRRS
ncbi:MAG: hypothetical protein AAF191_00325 [Verrucomicrobiota bacterium]